MYSRLESIHREKIQIALSNLTEEGIEISQIAKVLEEVALRQSDYDSVQKCVQIREQSNV